MSKQVVVLIDPKTGERKIEINGVTGTSCEIITEAIERNNEIEVKVYKDEYDASVDLPDYISPIEEE